jgi:hypothetical protein
MQRIPIDILQVSPPGVHVSFTVVVSFHDNFITKVDRAYRIQCAYIEADKTVKTAIDVRFVYNYRNPSNGYSMPQTTELTRIVEGPVCEYNIRSKEGVLIHAVKVGDVVQHAWECRSEVKGKSCDGRSKPCVFEEFLQC